MHPSIHEETGETLVIGLDTNVLVRYIVQDDHGHATAAAVLIESRCSASVSVVRFGSAMRTGVGTGKGR